MDTRIMTTERIQHIRDELPALTHTVYLNIGTCGPLPRRAVEVMRAAQDEELLHGRIALDHYPQLLASVNNLKAAVAHVLHCAASELAICRHTTDGMNLAIGGYPWQRGDEIVLTNIEHPSGLLPIFLARRRFGVEPRIADIGIGEGTTAEIVAAFERQITPRTRMLVLSHVPYTTGTILPLKEIVAMAHSHDVLVVADGAQSYGHIPLDLHETAVDFYACPGQKWMCGPEGTGVFYASAASLERIEQTIVGPFGMVMDSLDYQGGAYAQAEGAARFDIGSVNRPLLEGQRSATEWIATELGLEWALERIAALGLYARDALATLPDVRIITPRERQAGLLAFIVEGIDPEELTTRLFNEHNISTRFVTQYINNPRANRIGVGFYNTTEDIDQLAAAIATIRR